MWGELAPPTPPKGPDPMWGELAPPTPPKVKVVPWCIGRWISRRRRTSRRNRISCGARGEPCADARPCCNLGWSAP